ncbi:MAG TPA: HAD family hydrolase, partial [Bacteroidia bacterium]|nr:HAD family hydrolase [Bacteroidia bacterium]
MKDNTISTLFLDIGGVLLSNGWGREERARAIKHFNLDKEELNERHHLTFDTYEEGKLSLTDYLKRVVFYEPREFSEDEFIKFMYDQSRAHQEVIDFFKEMKTRYSLKVYAVSNEGKELNEFRIKAFKLNELFDAYISSSYIHLRKPDLDVFRMAIDISQSQPKNTLYIDDRLMFVEVAQ